MMWWETVLGTVTVVVVATCIGTAHALYPTQTFNPAPWRGHGVVPVIHNLETFQVPYVIDALEGFKCCTVSLRHATALDALKEMVEQFGPYCAVGASTVVSETQVQLAKAHGAQFVSTMFNAEALHAAATTLSLPILCGVLSHREASTALTLGADALKFYPSTSISPAQLRNTLQRLAETNPDCYFGNVPAKTPPGAVAGTGAGAGAGADYVDVYVAGGVREADFAAYVAAGANGFAIGLDCKLITPKQMREKLKELKSIFATAAEKAAAASVPAS